VTRVGTPLPGFSLPGRGGLMHRRWARAPGMRVVLCPGSTRPRQHPPASPLPPSSRRAFSESREDAGGKVLFHLVLPGRGKGRKKKEEKVIGVGVGCRGNPSGCRRGSISSSSTAPAASSLRASTVGKGSKSCPRGQGITNDME